MRASVVFLFPLCFKLKKKHDFTEVNNESKVNLLSDTNCINLISLCI